jgi:hypothetical protein
VGTLVIEFRGLLTEGVVNSFGFDLMACADRTHTASRANAEPDGHDLGTVGPVALVRVLGRLVGVAHVAGSFNSTCAPWTDRLVDRLAFLACAGVPSRFLAFLSLSLRRGAPCERLRRLP